MREVKVKRHHRKGKLVRAFNRTDKRKRKKKDSSKRNNLIGVSLGIGATIAVSAVILKKTNLLKASGIKPNSKVTDLAQYKPDNYRDIFGLNNSVNKKGKSKLFKKARRTRTLPTLLGLGLNFKPFSKATRNIGSILEFKKGNPDIEFLKGLSKNSKYSRQLKGVVTPDGNLDLRALAKVVTDIGKTSNKANPEGMEVFKRINRLASKDNIYLQVYKDINKLDPTSRKLMFDLDYVTRQDGYIKEEAKAVYPQIADNKNSVIYQYTRGYEVARERASGAASGMSKKQAKAVKRIKDTQALLKGATTPGERSASYASLDRQINRYKQTYNGSDPLKVGNTKVGTMSSSEKQAYLIKQGFSQEQLKFLEKIDD